MPVISMRPKRLTALVLSGGAALISLCLWAWFAGYRCNPTPSLPVGLYRLADGIPQRGDPVSFCLAGPFVRLAAERGYLKPGSCPSGLRPLLKVLAGLPGDLVRVGPDGIRVTSPGARVACPWPNSRIKTADRYGQPVTSALASGVIPPGFALVLGDHPGSFDSRYFGLVPLDSLRRTLPIFVWTPTKGKTHD